ncbi:ganglioside-induced differentiation-associated protein 1 isoform X2 [Strongylocentrotus purpuratus]|uniref:Uncharacterized protein n=1 Tax=Strongylocentrotus purpuratus TaxID=7668 RepID=A0A7M7SY15_STRPU|nr:ganglioside-induced differentiation-associated protein 1 isoform X2 [Strongylocentrotus purpuratus]
MASVPVLYHAEEGYFSQLARLALAEKGIDYKSHLISLATDEMHEAWFLRTVNPKGMVPAMEHHGKYYTDSSDIMVYVDTLPSDGPKLFPDDSSVMGDRVGHFSDLLGSINVRVVSYGSIFHRHLTVDSQVSPLMTKEKVRARIEGFGKNLAIVQEQNPDLKAGLSGRRGLYDEADTIFDEKRVIAVFEDVDRIFGEVEEELQKRKAEFGDDEYWLCGNTVTVADIHLSCFLHRLTFVGQAQRFYLSKRPLMTDYYNRILQRNSFRVACGDANSRFLKTK